MAISGSNPFVSIHTDPDLLTETEDSYLEPSVSQTRNDSEIEVNSPSEKSQINLSDDAVIESLNSGSIITYEPSPSKKSSVGIHFRYSIENSANSVSELNQTEDEPHKPLTETKPATRPPVILLQDKSISLKLPPLQRTKSISEYSDNEDNEEDINDDEALTPKVEIEYLQHLKAIAKIKLSNKPSPELMMIQKLLAAELDKVNEELSKTKTKELKINTNLEVRLTDRVTPTFKKSLTPTAKKTHFFSPITSSTTSFTPPPKMHRKSSFLNLNSVFRPNTLLEKVKTQLQSVTSKKLAITKEIDKTIEKQHQFTQTQKSTIADFEILKDLHQVLSESQNKNEAEQTALISDVIGKNNLIENCSAENRVFLQKFIPKKNPLNKTSSQGHLIPMRESLSALRVK